MHAISCKIRHIFKEDLIKLCETFIKFLLLKFPFGIVPVTSL